MGDEDPRTELLHASAVRTLDQQAASVDSLHVRAGILLSAASIITSFLVGIIVGAGEPRMDALGWTAVGCYILIVGLCLWILWPTPDWKFRPNAKKLAHDYIDADPGGTLSEMHRDLALHMENWAEVNAGKMQWLFNLFRAASLLLGIEVVLWMVDLWRR